MTETPLETARRVWPGEWASINMRGSGYDDLWREIVKNDVVSVMLQIERHSGRLHTTLHVNGDRRGFAHHPDLVTAVTEARNQVQSLARAFAVSVGVT